MQCTNRLPTSSGVYVGLRSPPTPSAKQKASRTDEQKGNGRRFWHKTEEPCSDVVDADTRRNIGIRVQAESEGILPGGESVRQIQKVAVDARVDPTLVKEADHLVLPVDGQETFGACAARVPVK